MLNFEDEMKFVRKGYVVLDIDEYNSIRDEVAAANMKAFEAEQLATRRIAESAANNKAIIDNLMRIEKQNYANHDIVIEFNTRAIRTLAIELLHETFSDEELAGYNVKSADDMLILDEVLAYHTSTVEATDNEE